MKKGILIFSISILGFVSCQEKEKCTRCVEENTQMVSTYCGTTAGVEEYKQELKSSGVRYKQNWVCD